MKNLIKKTNKTLSKSKRFNDFKNLVYGYFNRHEKGCNNDIFIFANARGVSTLLSNVLSLDKDSEEIFEPLNYKRFNNNYTTCEPTYKYIYTHPKRCDAIFNYFDAIFSNKITPYFPFEINNYRIKKPKRYVFKFINCKELMNQFEDRYDVSVIYFIRNPFATCLSRINWSWSDYNIRVQYIIDHKDNDHFFSKELKEYANEKLEYGTIFEKFMTAWAIENYIPLRKLNRDNWLVVSYEELLLDTTSFINKINKYTALSISADEAYERLFYQSNSTSAYTNLKNNNPKYKLDQWKALITEDQLEKGNDILKTFDLEVYKDNIFEL